ncbi:MAG: pilin [Patescibacteria group bacterium]|nr:pilin [Patescibacteria group bacterium]
MTEKIFAQIHSPGLPNTLGGDKNLSMNFGLTSSGKFISSLINVFLLLATIATMIYLILGGIQWITAGGDKNQLESARNKITHAVIGLLIVAGAWSVWILIGNFFGVSVNNLPFPTVSGN